MWTHPGKKLLFMGSEFGQKTEWAYQAEIDWPCLENPMHRGAQDLVRELNRLYRERPALHQRDCRGDGFQWIEGNAAEDSIYAFARFGEDDAEPVMAAFNFTPTPREGVRLGVPAAGRWRVLLNTDEARFGGSGVGNPPSIESEPEPAQGRSDSLRLTLPPLGAVILEREG
jgi:1,4-alpha-glucan branching enzyme